MTYAETDYRLGQRAGSALNGAQSRQYQQQAYYNTPEALKAAMAQQRAMAEAFARQQREFQRAREDVHEAFFGSGNGTFGQGSRQPHRPSVVGPVQWWVTLGVPAQATIAEIKSAYRKLAATAHPDKGGSTEAMAKLNAARDQAMRERKAA